MWDQKRLRDPKVPTGSSRGSSTSIEIVVDNDERTPNASRQGSAVVAVEPQTPKVIQVWQVEAQEIEHMCEADSFLCQECWAVWRRRH